MQIDVTIENDTGYTYISKPNSTGDTVTLTAPTSGTYHAKFSNPSGSPGQVQVHIVTLDLGPAIPSFELFICLGVLALILLLSLRKPTLLLQSN